MCRKVNQPFVFFDGHPFNCITIYGSKEMPDTGTENIYS